MMFVTLCHRQYVACFASVNQQRLNSVRHHLFLGLCHSSFTQPRDGETDVDDYEFESIATKITQ